MTKIKGIGKMTWHRYFHPTIQMHILPRGKKPERMSDEAEGYDSYLRAIVCPHNMDPVNGHLRQTLFDFQRLPVDPKVAKHVHKKEGGKLVYRMHPGESVLCGIGFLTAMPFPLMYWVVPRSGLASKKGITVTNSPGTVDSDYRGEAGLLVFNRRKSYFDLDYNVRICQILFEWAVIPRIMLVTSPEKLGKSSRGAGGFGSTGLMGGKKN